MPTVKKALILNINKLTL